MTYNELKLLNDRNKNKSKTKSSLGRPVERIEFVHRDSKGITFKYQGKNTTSISLKEIIEGIQNGCWYVSNISYLKYDLAKLDADDSLNNLIRKIEIAIQRQREQGYGAVLLTSLVGENAYLGNKLLYEQVRNYFLNQQNYMLLARPRHKEGNVVVETSEYIVWDLNRLTNR
jgi:hypothetical protein